MQHYQQLSQPQSLIATQPSSLLSHGHPEIQSVAFLQSPNSTMRSSASSSPSREAHGPLLQDEEKDYDEERLQRTSNNGTAPRWSLWSRKSSPRQPWPRKVKLWIFVIDIIIFIITVHAFSPLISLLQRNEELFGARLAFSQGDQPPGGQQTIPRILHQTVANETIPEKWTLSQKSCKDTYSDFEYKVNHPGRLWL